MRTQPGTPMTALQRQTLDFIASFIDRHGYPPAHRDIAIHWGGISTNAVNDRLRQLEARGLITRRAKVARGIALTQLGKEKAGRAGPRQPFQPGTLIDRTSPIMSGRGSEPVASSSEGDPT